MCAHIHGLVSPSTLSSVTSLQTELGEQPPLINPYSASYSRTNIRTIVGADDGGVSLVGQTLVVGGWVKSGREQGGGTFFFIQLNDGSIFTDMQVCARRAYLRCCVSLGKARRKVCDELQLLEVMSPLDLPLLQHDDVRLCVVTQACNRATCASGMGHCARLQVYMPKEVAESKGGKDLTKTGASLLVRGEITATPADVKDAKQLVELRATEVLHFGPCDPKTYPMAKKKHGMEFLRDKAHLRPRTNIIGAVARIRSQLSFATHEFFPAQRVSVRAHTNHHRLGLRGRRRNVPGAHAMWLRASNTGLCVLAAAPTASISMVYVRS